MTMHGEKWLLHSSTLAIEKKKSRQINFNREDVDHEWAWCVGLRLTVVMLDANELQSSKVFL